MTSGSVSTYKGYFNNSFNVNHMGNILNSLPSHSTMFHIILNIYYLSDLHVIKLKYLLFALSGADIFVMYLK